MGKLCEAAGGGDGGGGLWWSVGIAFVVIIVRKFAEPLR